MINAAGPWVDEIREVNKSKEGKSLHLTKGVHVVVPYHRLAVRQAVYFDVPDGRMIFAIPRGRVTYIGTTDTDYQGSIDEVFATRDDVRYLLDAVNNTFPGSHLNFADVESSWAGLRPLIHEEGKSASELSRKDEVFESPSGLLSIAGGKLTGYRKMSERVLDLLIERKFEERELFPCLTNSLVLTGGDFNSLEEIREYEKAIGHRTERMGLHGDDATYLTHLYGRNATVILEYMEGHLTGDAERDLAVAQAWYGLEKEMCIRLEDLLVRRSGYLFFDFPRLGRVKDAVLEFMAASLSWDDKRRHEERERMEVLIEKTLIFKTGT